jgi:hypothetical protein
MARLKTVKYAAAPSAASGMPATTAYGTTQNSRAARNDRALHTLSRNVFDREVKRVGKSDQCKQRGDDVKLPHLPPLRSSF